MIHRQLQRAFQITSRVANRRVKPSMINLIGLSYSIKFSFVQAKEKM